MSSRIVAPIGRTLDNDDNNRPVTSKPRGICRYYTTSRGCYAGDKCKFLHGQSERLTPYDKSKTCRFYAAGWCRHGDNCWFLHAAPQQPTSGLQETSQDNESEEYSCSICYDKPTQYGLLDGCSHIFCLSCIKNWRESEGKSTDIVEAGTTKTCPMCRTSSHFVTPSTIFYPEGDPKKAETVEKYKNSMAKVKCRYFEKSRIDNRYCPFGRDCFYKHENEDGTPYVFDRGIEYYMEQRRFRRDREEAFSFDALGLDHEGGFEAMLSTIARVFNNAHMSSRDMQRAVLSSVAAVFGADTLPPMYRLDNDPAEENDQPAALPDPPTVDQSEEGSPWNNWSERVLANPIVEDDNTRDSSISLLPYSMRVTSSPQSSVGATLDPTSPVFVPSYLDSMRPLPPGSSTSSQVETGEHQGGQFVADHGSETLGHHLWTFDDLVRRPAEPQHAEATVDTGTPMFSATLFSSAVPAEIDARQETVVQDADPPFMTDGRGRVVWSSTSARPREGRRGRAASSSATIIPTSKPASDLSTTEESADEALQQDVQRERQCSVSRRLMRQRSLPSVGSSVDAARDAEIVTDGRGRVVFASSNR